MDIRRSADASGLVSGEDGAETVSDVNVIKSSSSSGTIELPSGIVMVFDPSIRGFDIGTTGS